MFFNTAIIFLVFLVSLCVYIYVHVCVSLKRIYEVASDGVFREFVNGIKHASASFIRCLSCLSLA